MLLFNYLFTYKAPARRRIRNYYINKLTNQQNFDRNLTIAYCIALGFIAMLPLLM